MAEELVGLGSTVITQIDLVVHDIEKTIDAYCKILGLPQPSIIITDEFELARTQYHGHPTKARAKLAFFHLGQVDLELIEPIGEPSTWKEALTQNGEGFHHIAFQIKDTNRVLRAMAEHGIPLVQQGQYTGGMYSYLDASNSLKLVLELLENF